MTREEKKMFAQTDRILKASDTAGGQKARKAIQSAKVISNSCALVAVGGDGVSDWHVHRNLSQ